MFLAKHAKLAKDKERVGFDLSWAHLACLARKNSLLGKE
jgi:hypothetical protein